MQVTISVGGKFHAFYLAQQLLKRGCLKKIVTSYPYFEVKRYGLPAGKVSSFVSLEILERLWARLPEMLRCGYNPQFVLAELFDKRASSCIESSDIFVGWSGFSLHTLRRAKEMGSVVLIERGSSHIFYQQEILKEEYERLGLKFKGAHPAIVEKELAEYDEADYIEVPSSFAKKTFLQAGIKEEKIIQSPLGVSLPEFCNKAGKTDNVFRIIYAGALSLRKGVHYLLQAFSELSLPDAELWLIGVMDREIYPFFKQYNNGKVFYKGPHPQKELYKYYSQGSVFVLPSIEDGFGMVIAQALACGLPVICTSNSGGPDIVREGVDGYIIPIRSVPLLKERIARLYENPGLLINLAVNAKKRVESGFTWDNYGEQVVERYGAILKRGA
jgi:glycosyltransferase involved in cell wall biosynthesis